MNQNSPQIETINCKNCGASLEILGNNFRLKNLCCAYCGTIMDSQHEFKALYTFTHIRQPNTPLSIGMQGIIKKTSFTITAYIAFKNRDEEWIQFFLYSPTHGYALLIRKKGRYLFLRRTYYLPDKNLWTLKQGDTFRIDQQTFQISHMIFADIYYASGSFPTPINESKRQKQSYSHSKNQWFLSIQLKNSVEYYKGDEIEDASLESRFI